VERFPLGYNTYSIRAHCMKADALGGARFSLPAGRKAGRADGFSTLRLRPAKSHEKPMP
jgi:hypothetical protein